MIIFLAGNTARITPCHKVTISCYLCVVFMYQYLDTMVYDYRFVDTVNTIKDITEYYINIKSVDTQLRQK